MRTTRTIEITVETDEVMVVRRLGGSVSGWCAECGERVEMVTPDEAARIAGVTTRTVYRWIEADEVHFAETQEGLLLVCGRSVTSDCF